MNTTYHDQVIAVREAKRAKLDSMLGRVLLPSEAMQLRTLAADLGVRLQWSRKNFNGPMAGEWVTL